MTFFNHHDHKIAFEKKGTGPAVYLLHGFCEDQRVWEQFSGPLVNAGFQVVTIDLPGFGQSDTILPASIADMSEMVEQLRHELHDDRIVLVGHSMGGYITLAYAEKYPDRLKGWGLFHSHPFEDSAAKKEARQKSMDFIEKNGAAPYVKELIPKLFPARFADDHPDVVLSLVDKAVNYDPKGIINALEAMKNRTDRSEVLKRSKSPVLFIIGKKDDLEPQDVLISQTHLPDLAVIHLLEEVGHMGMFESPEKTISLMIDFTSFCETKS